MVMQISNVCVEGDVVVSTVKLQKLKNIREKTIKFYFSIQKEIDKYSLAEIKKENIRPPTTERTLEVTSLWPENFEKHKTSSTPFWQKTLLVASTSTKPPSKPAPPDASTVLSATPDYSNQHLDNDFSKHSLTINQTKKSTKRLPTLTEVSNLFDEYYSYVEYYPWKLDEDIVKRIFIKILENYAENNFDLAKKKKLKKFLQSKVNKYSAKANKLVLDPTLYNRYNYIIMDSIERKLMMADKAENNVTIISQPSVMTEHHNETELLNRSKPQQYMDNITKQTNLQRPEKENIKWKPEKSPNSPLNADISQSQYHLPFPLHITPNSSKDQAKRTMIELKPWNINTNVTTGIFVQVLLILSF